MNPLPPLQTPDTRALLNAHRDEVFSSFNCHQIGTIQSFNGDKQTASVSINAKRVVFNKAPATGRPLQLDPVLVDYPILTDVKVVVPSGGGGSLQFPITAGDVCVLHFNDRDIDLWAVLGDSGGAPNSPRMHSLSDAIAEVGVFSDASPLQNYDPTAVRLVYAGAVIKITQEGAIELDGSGGEVVKLASGKVGISNGSGSLKSALDSLFTALTGWVDTHGDTPNPATIAAITAAKTATDAILS